jgi:hypothetical protein
MDANDCRTVRREIDASELGQRLSGPLEMHLAACAACAQFRTERAQLRELVGSLKPVAAPADFDLRLRARMAREKDAGARQPFIFRFALTTPGIAVAALIVVTIASIVWINQRRQTVNTPIASQNSNNEKPAGPAPVPAKPENPVPANPENKGTEPNEGLLATMDSRRTPKRLNPAGRSPVKSLPVSADPPAQVSEFNTRGAQSIRQNRDRAGEVSLTAPSQPMVVSVQDAKGARHKILLPPISFGSQRLDNRTSVGMTNRKDW